MGHTIVMLLITGVLALLKHCKVIDSGILWNVKVMDRRDNLEEYVKWERRPLRKSEGSVKACRGRVR